MIIPAADGTPLFVQGRGEGHPLILLHGLGSWTPTCTTSPGRGA